MVVYCFRNSRNFAVQPFTCQAVVFNDAVYYQQTRYDSWKTGVIDREYRATVCWHMLSVDRSDQKSRDSLLLKQWHGASVSRSMARRQYHLSSFYDWLQRAQHNQLGLVKPTLCPIVRINLYYYFHHNDSFEEWSRYFTAIFTQCGCKAAEQKQSQKSGRLSGHTRFYLIAIETVGRLNVIDIIWEKSRAGGIIFDGLGSRNVRCSGHRSICCWWHHHQQHYLAQQRSIYHWTSELFRTSKQSRTLWLRSIDLEPLWI